MTPTPATVLTVTIPVRPATSPTRPTRRNSEHLGHAPARGQDHGIHAHTRLHRHQHDRRGSRAVTVLLTTALALLLLAITGGCTTEDH
ncbi:MAG: hypothetical protein ACRCSN_08585, partial [Dermatophilaceae bacterium]